MSPVTDISNWIVVSATVGVVVLCVGLHYEVLRGCSQFLPYVSHQRRRRILFLILIILVTHVVEMWIFAVGYFLLVKFEPLGTLNGLGPFSGEEIMALPDYAYYSAMVYTTVGFGDIVPTGPIRFMTGMEALTGLVMITWSASFTFLGMQRYWRPD